MKIKIPILNIILYINEKKTYKHKGIYGVTKEAKDELDRTKPRKK